MKRKEPRLRCLLVNKQLRSGSYVFFPVFVLASGSMDVRDISIYGCMCIDIWYRCIASIIWYNKGLGKAPPSPLQNNTGKNTSIETRHFNTLVPVGVQIKDGESKALSSGWNAEPSAKFLDFDSIIFLWWNINYKLYILKREQGSSVSIVSGYGWTTGRSRFDHRQRRKNFFSSLCVQTRSWAHPASCTMGTGSPFPGVKARPGREADRSPHLVPRSWMSRSYTSSSPSAFMACSGTGLALYK
jgi:hypothetical protein